MGKDKEEYKEDNKYNLIWEIVEKQMFVRGKYENNNFQFYHYTSTKSLFNILESDSLWGSNVRFSNDTTEEQLLESDKVTQRDDFVVCFCGKADQLRQWRGYCAEGGGAIKLHIKDMSQYSILHADYDDSGRYELYSNAPLPVLYLSVRDAGTVKRDLNYELETSRYKDKGIHKEDILPYLKNSLFYEEKESRLVFPNIEGSLSECLRFRELDSGIKVPYMVIKYGDIGKMARRYRNSYKEWDLGKPERIIYLEEGFEQENRYYELMEQIHKKEEKEKTNMSIRKYQIFCKGHLPIEKIYVAPSYDQKRRAEQIKQYCNSKYWLRNVEVVESEIPYRPSYNY